MRTVLPPDEPPQLSKHRTEVFIGGQRLVCEGLSRYEPADEFQRRCGQIHRQQVTCRRTNTDPVMNEMSERRVVPLLPTGVANHQIGEGVRDVVILPRHVVSESPERLRGRAPVPV